MCGTDCRRPHRSLAAGVRWSSYIRSFGPRWPSCNSSTARGLAPTSSCLVISSLRIPPPPPGHAHTRAHSLRCELLFGLAWTRVGRLSLEGARSAALQERANALEYAQASQVGEEPLPKSISVERLHRDSRQTTAAFAHCTRCDWLHCTLRHRDRLLCAVWARLKGLRKALGARASPLCTCCTLVLRVRFANSDAPASAAAAADAVARCRRARTT